MSELKFSPFRTLLTERLILRQLEENDFTVLSRLRSDERVNRFLDRPKKTSEEDAKLFIRKINDGIDRGESFYWGICLRETSGLIGAICIWNISDDKKTGELGYELDPAYQGQGIMNEAIGEVIRFAINKIGLTNIEAYTHKENLASSRLLLKNHFKPDPGRKDPTNDTTVIYVLSTGK